MASVNDYLKKLLYQYDCVVVPELGAFLTHYQPAAFTETNGLYLPPRKRVAFNEALRFDDGILANYIMLHEPLMREGAQRHISLFVNELHQQVETTGRFELDGIGTFTQNDEGRLQFGPSLRHNFFGESYGLSAVSTQLINRQPQRQPALEAVPVTALGPVLVSENTTLTPYRPSRPYWRVAAVALLVGSLGAFSYFSVIHPGQPLQSSLDPVHLLRVSTSFFERSTAATNIPVVHKTAPVSVSAVETTPVVMPVEMVVSVPAPVPADDEPKPGVISVESKVKLDPTLARKSELVQKALAPIVKPARTGPYFTVIAGVFLSKRNANRLKRQLRKAGYSDAFVIMPGRGQKGQLYKVAAAGSSVREEAVTNLAAITTLAGSEAWIYKN